MACGLSMLRTYKVSNRVSVCSKTPKCTVSPVWSHKARKKGTDTSEASMRSRTKPPKENNSKPKRYLPSAGFCSKKPSATKVEASRCAVLLAT